MGLSRLKLGDLIEQCDERNTQDLLKVEDVRGISTGKDFIETKANMTGVKLTSYKVVNKNEFAYVADTSRRGDKIALAFNSNDKRIIVSSIYTVFRVSRVDLLNPFYLFIYFNRPEFDRFSRFNSWGSARETFSWEDFCNIEISLPPLDIQQKYVDVYNAMLANQQSYERGLEDLKLTCDALIDDYKHKAAKICVGDILQEVDNRNANNVADVHGINITKQFMPSVANTTDVDLAKYKLVQKGQFAFSGMQTGRDECIRIALFDKDDPIIISPAYSVLEMKRDDTLPEYVMMWFSRKEVDRLGWFLSDASIRTNLDMESFYEIEIPVPDEKTQKSIVDIYQSYNARKEIREKLKTQIKNLCPVLIKGSIEEAARV